MQPTFRPFDKIVVDGQRNALYIRAANGRHLVALTSASDRVERAVLVTFDRIATRAAIKERQGWRHQLTAGGQHTN